MSAEAFVHYGSHYGLVTRKPAGVYLGDVEIYDIGEEHLVGVRYSDNSRQAQPQAWHPGVRRLLAAHVRERPRLKKNEPKPKLFKHQAYQPLPRPTLKQQRIEPSQGERDAVEVVGRLIRGGQRPALEHKPDHPLANVAAAELAAARPHIKKRRYG